MNEPRNRLPLWSGVACAAWALIAWFTVIPDGDRLADQIQVQDVLRDPHVVLAFPGQTHGGVLEYPVLLLAEWIAPGNYFVHAFPRVLFAFLTGFFAARLFLRLFPLAPRWGFLLAVLAGPAVMHGLTGPQGNAIGVMWLHANYPQSWLLVTIGLSLLADEASRQGRPRWWWLVLTGALIGMGVYEQSSVLLLAVPMVIVLMFAFPHRWTTWLVAASGSVVGVVLMVASYLLHFRESVYNPAHLPIPSLAASLRAVGLDGLDTFRDAILPAGLGFAPVDDSFLRPLAAVLVPALLVTAIVTLVVAALRSWRARAANPAFLLSGAWLTSVAMMMLMAWVMGTLWFYGGGLGVLLWLTVGALPLIQPRWLGVILTAAAVALMAFSTFQQTFYFYKDAPAQFEAKVARMDDLSTLADAIVAQGGTHLFGSFWDVMPLAYSSGGDLRPSAIYYDRFPLPDGSSDPMTVFVNVEPTEYHGDDAWVLVQERCEDLGVRVTSGTHVFGEFRCPLEVVSPRR